MFLIYSTTYENINYSGCLTVLGYKKYWLCAYRVASESVESCKSLFFQLKFKFMVLHPTGTRSDKDYFWD